MRPPARLLLAACAVLALQACVMVPVTKLRYDEGCRTTVKEMTLQPVQLASIGGWPATMRASWLPWLRRRCFFYAAQAE